MKSKVSLLLLIILMQMTIVFAGPVIGTADNSDFSRSLEPFGLSRIAGERYFYFYTQYTIKAPKSSLAYFGDLFQRTIPGPSQYFSTQFVFTKAALLANSLYNKVTNQERHLFDLRILGFLYVLFYSVAVWLLATTLFRNKGSLGKWLISGLSIFILMDSGYLVYMNSFYGEAPSLILLVLSLGLILQIMPFDKKRICLIPLALVSIFVFSGSKMANFPTALLLITALLLAVLHKASNWIRIATLVLTIITITMMVSILKTTPEWMDKVTTYQSVFYGVLKDNPEMKTAVSELGLNPSLEELANRNAYMDRKGFDIYGEDFKALFYDRIGRGSVLEYYLRHPRFFFAKLVKSSEASLSIRATYLGNFRPEDQPERLTFATRFRVWENFRKLFSGKAFLSYALVFALCFLLILGRGIHALRIRDRVMLVHSIFQLLLVFGALGQFLVPIIGNGEADLMKHMFLFNASFDVMLIVVLAAPGGRFIIMRKQVPEEPGSIQKTSSKEDLVCTQEAPSKGGLFTRRYASFIQIVKHKPFLWIGSIVILGTLALLIILWFPGTPSNVMRVGNTVQFGSRNGKPILWKIIETEGRTARMSSVEILGERAFDAIVSPKSHGGNRWANSDIRHWLNTEFLDTTFSVEEKRNLLPKISKSLLAESFLNDADGGDRPLFWFAMPAFAKENSDRAYYEWVEDRVSLMDLVDLDKLFALEGRGIIKRDMNGKKTRYWLKTPYYSSDSMVRTVDTDGFVYHKDADVETIGIVPVITIYTRH